MVYIGVDLHRKSSHLAVLSEDGELLASRRITSRPEEFLRVFGELEPEPLEVAFEATYGWGWFVDLLTDVGIPAHMAHPLAVKAISTARVKNDRVDAKTLAHLLRSNLLPEAWAAPPEVRDARLLVRTRISLVRISSRLKCQTHALLADQGISSPVTDLFGPGGRAFLEEVRLRPVPQARLQANLRLMDLVAVEVAEADRELRGLFRGDARIPRLLPIPGIGFTTAAVVVAEVWDHSRFPSPGHLCSWAGLTPTEHSSAEHTRRGHISKQGSRWLRWAMVESASGAYLKDPALRRFRDGIARRRGAKIAKVALARRLLTLCYYALRDEGGCRAYPAMTSDVVGARSPRVMASLGTAVL
jgi:transposase